MQDINLIAQEYEIKIIEEVAQADEAFCLSNK
jgi:hypothetical protein